MIASFSVEFKFRFMILGICKFLWLKVILEDLKVKWKCSIRLYCENKSAFNITYNLMQHDHIKHIDVDLLMNTL